MPIETSGFNLGADDQELRLLQIELVKLQKSLIANGDQILLILEGRDTAGKDGTIKAITEHLSPRETRVVALGKPSDVEADQWYFQRYIAQLPRRGEFVLFNRSWYNRAGVEMVMGFCSKAQYATFLSTVNSLESILIQSGITVLKYYLDISKSEQKLRLGLVKMIRSSNGRSVQLTNRLRKNGMRTVPTAMRCYSRPAQQKRLGPSCVPIIKNKRI